jgi:hypothetical protein
MRTALTCPVLANPCPRRHPFLISWEPTAVRFSSRSVQISCTPEPFLTLQSLPETIHEAGRLSLRLAWTPTMITTSRTSSYQQFEKEPFQRGTSLTSVRLKPCALPSCSLISHASPRKLRRLSTPLTGFRIRLDVHAISFTTLIKGTSPSEFSPHFARP